MEAILKFDQVSKDYPNGVHALKKVSFEVSEGEFVSVIGPSGSGKSTLLRAINRLIPVSSGTVWLDGQAVSAQKGKKLREQRCKVGMIFQNYNLVYSLSVLQNVLHGRLGYMSGLKGVFGLYSEQDKQEALDLLEELGLEQFCYNRASDLSGGQKQRVGIARAIMQKPKLLLCDEPIASLDPSSAKTIMDLLRDMSQKRKIACIVNLHQLDVAVKYSTRNVLHGRLGYMSGLKGVFGLYSEQDKQEALDLLEELGLEQFCYNRASDLSGGQKQRVGIARAIMQKPKLLLCDEPIASLDPSSAKTIMDLLRDMSQKRKIACIVNLHQLDVAVKYSTRIIGLSKGEIVFDGTPEELDDRTIEKIYGTSRENLMMGGNADDKADTVDCA